MRIYHRRGAGRPIRIVWTLEELGVSYDLVTLTSEEAAAGEIGRVILWGGCRCSRTTRGRSLSRPPCACTSRTFILTPGWRRPWGRAIVLLFISGSQRERRLDWHVLAARVTSFPRATTNAAAGRRSAPSYAAAPGSFLTAPASPD